MDFERFAPIANEMENIRINDEGTIDIQYMADIGDDSLFLGDRRPASPREVSSFYRRSSPHSLR